MTNPVNDPTGDGQNTELLHFTGDALVNGVATRFHTSLDLHTCEAGHTHYVVYYQTEVMVDDLDAAMVLINAQNSGLQLIGVPLARVEL